MGAQNGVVGDQALEPNVTDTEAPQAAVVDDAVLEERRLAAFAKTTDYNDIKEYWEQRRQFYQLYLPNGDNVLSKDDVAKLGENWKVANIVIGEIGAFLSRYEGAGERLQDNAAGQ